MAVALVSGCRCHYGLAQRADLPVGLDLVAIPGVFSFGDYLRCGAIAAQSPICSAVKDHVERGGFALGVCNGFQVLTETGLLPGALMRNSGLKFLCNTQSLKVVTSESAFTEGYNAGSVVGLPIAHHDGNYTADADTIAMLKAEDRIAFTYEDTPMVPLPILPEFYRKIAVCLA